MGVIQQIILLKRMPEVSNLIGNQVNDNQFGLNGTDLNGRDLFYDGNGIDNCFRATRASHVTVPADGSTFAPCPFTGANTFDGAAQSEAINWASATRTRRSWVKHPHAAKAGHHAAGALRGGP